MMNNYDSSIKEMQTQLFNVLAVAACGANLFGSILNAVLHGNALPTQICVICGIIILALCLFGLSTRYKGLATVGILITVVWIEFPFLYSVYESIILIYFILSIAGIAIYFPRQFSIPFCIITIIWDILIIVLFHFYPLYNIPIDETGLLVFTICSYLIVAFAISFLLYSLIMRYEKQKLELFILNERLEFAANHDSLTRLYNRGYLISQIEKRMKQDNAHFIAVIMDIDDFKQINDTYGHTLGDRVLCTFAKFMEEEVGTDGFAARFGGEEFMIIFDHADRDKALQVLNNLSNKLESHFMNELNTSITFSGGLELYSNRKKIDELIMNADNKLYQAKRNGKNQIVC